MTDLFYSGDEKILFWVTGYNMADNTQKITEMINSLHDLSIEFIVESKQVGKNRRRYKYMRVLWCEGVESYDVPEDAFHITGENGWTMWKWLKD